MPPPTQTQDRLARAQLPFSSSSSSRASGKGKLPVTTGTAAAASTSASASGAQQREEGEGKSNEMWESCINRQTAANVLGSWEELVWYGVSGRESLPQIRLAYQKKMLGIPSSDSDVEWRDDYYGERSSWDDMQRQQLELSDGGTAAGSARERKSGSRAGGVGRGSPIGRGGRGSSRQR